ncbi:MFS transporter [Solwaraspora sp. WMMD406]|uniref:MFS transporter n=1 Tax=Solwaraspora sp. WMMD406 TaxID=3016095 RepID=UPI00241775F0|nr:MFS transporter [Solwaraspora sp. WMMD406]MDG4767699.1 MFS transporter [Solwaraspora sp. WMMD406]
MSTTSPSVTPGVGRRRATPMLAAVGISTTGDGAFFLAAPLLATTITDDPVALGLVTAAFSIPWLLFGMPAGALVDRWPKRRTMIVADLVRVIALAVLAVLIVVDQVGIGAIIAVVVVLGIAQCFFDTASQSMIPLLVGRDEAALQRFNSRYWALDMLGRGLIGPPLGSLSFAVGRVVPFVGDAVTFAVSAVMVRLLPVVDSPTPGRHTSIMESLRCAATFVWRSRALLVQYLSGGAYNFAFRLATSTLVLYLTLELALSEAATGVLFAVGALGGVAGSWVAPRILRSASAMRLVLAALLLQAISWLIVLVAPGVGAVAVAMVLAGGASSLITVPVVSTQQSVAPVEMLGRVSSIFRFISATSASAGAAIGGVVAAEAGLRAPFAVGMVILCVATFLLWVAHRRAVAVR